MQYTKRKPIKRKHEMRRRAISPIIATVIIIAATLVAGVAVAGFVFGIFGTQTATSQVTASTVAIKANATTLNYSGTYVSLRCTPTTSTTGGGSITLINNGAASNTVVSISITFGAKTYSNTTTTGWNTCNTVTSGSSTIIYIVNLPQYSTAGQIYVGEAALADGTRIPFTGSFK